jgi:zinc protease
MIPTAGPPRSATLPAPRERTLDNGLRVVAFEQRALPLIAAQLVVRCGGAAEHEDEAGLSAFVAALLTQGTTQRDALALAQASDALGARLEAVSGYDASLVSVSATTPAFPAAFALLDEIVRQPSFAPAEVERVRTKSISDLALTYANPSALARLVAQRVAYAGAPYGHPLAGTQATLAALTRERAAWFHERFYRPDDAVLVISRPTTRSRSRSRCSAIGVRPRRRFCHVPMARSRRRARASSSSTSPMPDAPRWFPDASRSRAPRRTTIRGSSRRPCSPATADGSTKRSA